jgi:hypothetical protein
MENPFISAPNPRGHAKYQLARRQKRPSLITVPERAHPIAKLIFAEMKKQGKTYSELEFESGVLVTTTKAWRQHSRPSIESAEAALGALGWSLVPVPRMDRLPEKLQSGIARLSTEWIKEEPILGELLAEMCQAPIIARSGRLESFVRLRDPIGGILVLRVEQGAGVTVEDISRSTGLELSQVARLSPSDRAEILRLMACDRGRVSRTGRSQSCSTLGQS